MKKIIYITFLIFCFFSCVEEELITKDGFSSVSLTLNTSDNNIISKAVSSKDDERRINDIYVFIFSSDGSLSHREYFQNLNNTGTAKLSLKNIPSGNKNIYVVANISAINNGFSQLNLVADSKELDALIAKLEILSLERGTNFIMSGKKTDVLLKSNETNDVKVPLVRIDAKVQFKLNAGSEITFYPMKWRVCSVPKSFSVFDDKNSDKNSDKIEFEDNYFDSDWLNFDEVEESYSSFAFYCPENKVSAIKDIPVTGNDISDYSLREKRLKTPDDDGEYVTNGKFEYAPETATYVQIKGNIRYKNNSDVSADVVYTVLLGGVESVNDYNTVRNTNYTYNVTINSVNQIVTEVFHVEIRPGVEGEIVYSSGIIDLDAYNEIILLEFEKKHIDNSLTWSVYTPFASGSADNDPIDYEWIHFGLNDREAKNYGQIDKEFEYLSEFVVYPGDNEVYSDEEFEKHQGYRHFLDLYLADVRAYVDEIHKPGNGNNNNNARLKLLNIKQLIEVLKESKRRSDSGNRDNLFDMKGSIKFTAFVREFYYEYRPGDSNKEFKSRLWKEFVNKDKRIMNISTGLLYSEDKNSAIFSSLYSIRQASIASIYNQNLSDDFTAWGTQAIPDRTMKVFESINRKITGTYNDSYNGRKNCVNMWISSNVNSWKEYMNHSDWSLTNDYNSVKYQCLKLNRDINGNGIIEQNEIQWYLTSINQLTDLWIGEPALDPSLKLYANSKWIIADQWYASSTVLNRNGSLDDPKILWSAEGSSISILSKYTNGIKSKVNYRCVRNLGIINSAGVNVAPDDFVEYDKNTRKMSLEKLDPKALRSVDTKTELPRHTERDERGNNRPFKRFEINPGTHGVNLGWKDLQVECDNNTLCPQGWHTPNQRELSLMYSRITSNLWNNFWGELSYYFARSSFSFNTSKRYGFCVNKGAAEFLLINEPEVGKEPFEKGGVRCIRDIPDSTDN